jgi:xylulokinase
LPYLAGERSPFHDPAARGAFIGLALDTGRAHLLKAVLEGVALSLAAIGDLIDPPRPDGQPLRLCGGGSRSPSWCQIFADIFGEPVVRIASMEHVGLIGAARLTAPSLGWQPPAEPDGDEELALRPDTADPAAYRELRALHQRAYPQLREIVHQLPRPTGAPEPELKHSNRKEPST